MCREVTGWRAHCTLPSHVREQGLIVLDPEKSREGDPFVAPWRGPQCPFWELRCREGWRGLCVQQCLLFTLINEVA